ncbi:MAG: hypothetical protein ACI91B_001844 [Planctomycetota bacterium]|jgi:hypothetical protein
MNQPVRKPSTSRRRRIAIRLALVAFGLVLALLAAEVGLRICMPHELFVPGSDRKGWTENTATFDAFMRVDADLGYIPIPDTQLYDQRGCNRDSEVDKAFAAEGPSVLWLGDSVTSRRFIEREVRRRCDVPFQSWCGGVEGYNVAQSYGYYRDVLSRLEPMQVVFTLHHNDWLNTPIVFYDDEGKVHCRETDHDVAWFSPWLFRHCYLYRLLFTWSLQDSGGDEAHATQKVEQALTQLRDELAAEGRSLWVLLLPLMKPETEWTNAEQRRHATAQAVLTRLRVRHVDLLPGLRRALADHVDPQQLPGDSWHPSEAVAVYLADELLAAGYVPGK